MRTLRCVCGAVFTGEAGELLAEVEAHIATAHAGLLVNDTEEKEQATTPTPNRDAAATKSATTEPRSGPGTAALAATRATKQWRRRTVARLIAVAVFAAALAVLPGEGSASGGVLDWYEEGTLFKVFGPNKSG